MQKQTINAEKAHVLLAKLWADQYGQKLVKTEVSVDGKKVFTYSGDVIRNIS